MLYDKEFLKQLDKSRTKTKYARITTLTWDENPIQSVEGRVTQGSISLDGASAVRRTCSLTMVVEDVDVSNYYWGLNTKFKLEVGIKNNVNNNYPDIIWFPQGIYLITNFSSALSVNNFTLSIQGKDKMSLLNGDIGGSITAQTQFDSWEEEIDGEWVIKKYPIKQIIRDAVHQYGGEPFHNIIINDLDEKGLELLEYRYDVPMFLIREASNNEYIQGTLDGTTRFDSADDGFTPEIGAKDENGNYVHSFDLLVDSLAEVPDPTVFYKDGVAYCVAKIEYGDTAGYRVTSLIYPDDLIGNVGKSLTSILDKLKNMLGEFEYFYDLDGRFVFQKKQNYVDTVWSPIEEKEGYVKEYAITSDETYVFSGNELITAFNNQPNLNNIRNDYSVWGSRKSASGSDIPIHMRYAIDEKPVYYKTFDGIEYCTKEEYCTAHGVTYVIWQELIYQMQADYRKHNHDDDYELMIMKNNPPIDELNFSGYMYGRTGYEIYYIDIEGFWRQLYYPEYAYHTTMAKYETRLKALYNKLAEFSGASEDKQYVENEISILEQEIIDFNSKYSETFATIGTKINKYEKSYDALTRNSEISEEIIWSGTVNFEPYYNYWDRLVYEEPENLNFWFDFLDLDGDLNKYSCKAIGARPKAVNDSNVKSIYFRSTPTIIFYESALEKSTHTGYRYFQVADIESMCSVSTQGKSAKEAVDELLYNYSYALESVSITAIPIYYLQLNSRVNIHDERAGISGDYIVTKMTLPLTYNGTMSLTATKAVDAII